MRGLHFYNQVYNVPLIFVLPKLSSYRVEIVLDARCYYVYRVYSYRKTNLIFLTSGHFYNLFDWILIPGNILKPDDPRLDLISSQLLKKLVPLNNNQSALWQESFQTGDCN